MLYSEGCIIKKRFYLEECQNYMLPFFEMRKQTRNKQTRLSFYLQKKLHRNILLRNEKLDKGISRNQ